jgi:Ca2+-binding EF-hand superfamily protein
MKDLMNLKKAFELLDEDKDGKILYDVKKISKIKKKKNEEEIERLKNSAMNDNILINFDQFMNLMTENIIYNRQKFGKEAVIYESDISNVSCFICPSSN